MNPESAPEAVAEGTAGLPGMGFRLLVPVYRRAGSAYLAGPDRSRALIIAERLVAAGSDVTLGYWPPKGEAVRTVAAEAAATIEALGSYGARAGLALKAPALGFDRCAVQQLARQAGDTGVQLVFDSHSPDQAGRTLALARASLAEGARVEVALAARWTRSLDDAVLAAGEGMSVRLVKGQWAEDGASRGPAGEAALRASFLALLELLLERRVPVSAATHDLDLLGESMRRMTASGVDPHAELLLGLPVRRALSVTQRYGARVRFYIGFGHPGLPYPFTSILRRPRLARTLTQGVLLGALNLRIQLRAALIR